MPILNVIDRSGQRRTVEGASGLSVMEVIRENGFDDLLALCGGCCSCATCHVHIAPQWLTKLPPISGDEQDLLDSASDRAPTSRLSCQIPFSDALDGLTLTIAAAD
ncbi:2Fe-2S iron-sulfur cluster-binding protein [Nitrospirillum iridis]|uniref:2Fe-2S ferredoxin n=1 Tax=Nitrospirillum iridis TaxID=765888 RepID=A0A7X0B6U6_9PROT|nr:2Fe-2S iron-sulfur cluster-binding protein [Nitrospirillum iridis]MBB6255249.1 2Fe-2S ferredoxin [Nitrospirillum iridis]